MPAIGVDVDGFAVGHRVLAHSTPLLYQGAWAERFLAPAAAVAAIPDGLAEDAASPQPCVAQRQPQLGRDRAPGCRRFAERRSGRARRPDPRPRPARRSAESWLAQTADLGRARNCRQWMIGSTSRSAPRGQPRYPSVHCLAIYDWRMV
jgi:hypothetical protein